MPSVGRPAFNLSCTVCPKHGSKADNMPEYRSSGRTLNGNITSPSILINRITFHMPGPARRQDLEAI